MNDFFIQKLDINEVRDINNFNIPLNEEERKHLRLNEKIGLLDNHFFL